MNTGKSDITVSVCMITYNHEMFIEKAIEGVLMQKTNFPVELVIGEDCSTDRTREICLKYKNEYPDRIKLLLREKNLGIMGNFIDTLQSCTGRYIALCEGDDYWTDPYKLQKQADFLDANAGFSICFHSVKVLKRNRLRRDKITRDVPETTDIYTLAEGNYIHTPSVMYRRRGEVLKEFEKAAGLSVGDYVLHMFHARYGKIKKIPDAMAVYRIHEGGVWSLRDKSVKYRKWLELLDFLIAFFDTDQRIKVLLQKQYCRTAANLTSDNDPEPAAPGNLRKALGFFSRPRRGMSEQS